MACTSNGPRLLSVHVAEVSFRLSYLPTLSPHATDYPHLHFNMRNDYILDTLVERPPLDDSPHITALLLWDHASNKMTT